MFQFRASFFALLVSLASACSAVVWTADLSPGSKGEAKHLLDPASSTIVDGFRVAEPGAGWTYLLPTPPGAQISLSLELEGEARIAASGPDGKPISVVVTRGEAALLARLKTPAAHPPGAAVRIRIAAAAVPVRVRRAIAQATLPDTNGDGLPDHIGVFLGAGAKALRPPPEPMTSFQTGRPFEAELASPADAVLVYSADPAIYESWRNQGYIVQTMGGFREGTDYARKNPDEVQTDREGRPIEIGPGSFYLIPTKNRNEISKRYFRAAIAAGTTAVCPEEPEIWSRAGYSNAFKQAWQEFYGKPWVPPHTSEEARNAAEHLKQLLTKRQIEAILADAQAANPGVRRMLALHSPVTYAMWGLPVPHAALFSLPQLQEVIGQVWTGTARSAARAAGVRAERTFHVGFLEYSSLYQLVRGTGKKLWFLMDPLEDNPDRTPEDYRRNYIDTLAAALMFPEVRAFETMPWPERIFGRVSPEYAITINAVTGALADLWRYSKGTVEAGSTGIGVLIADSLGRQRESPSASDYDGFFGLCLPLVGHGVPVQVLSLDRAEEPGYLASFKVLLLSYDLLKPDRPEMNAALSNWVRAGGSLVLFEGGDAYERLPDSWWRKAGFISPVDDLLERLGARAGSATHTRSPSYDDPRFGNVLLRAPAQMPPYNNRSKQELDLTALAKTSRAVAIKFEDTSPSDGWGPLLYSAELRYDGKIAASFRTGSALETRFLAEERGSKFNGEGRFADGNGYFVYRFDNLPENQRVTLSLDIENGYLVRAAPGLPPAPALHSTGEPVDPRLASIPIAAGYAATSRPVPNGATPLYRKSGSGETLVWEWKSGSGNLLYAGVSPGLLTATAQTDRWMRALASRALKAAGGTYAEATAFVSRRGPYVAVRTLSAEKELTGRYVNLLDPQLPILEDPVIPERSGAFLVEAPKTAARLLAAAGRVTGLREGADGVGFAAKGPAGTWGAARIQCGSRKVLGAKAMDLLGRVVSVSVERSGSTVLVRYPNSPSGVAVRVSLGQ